MPALTQILLHSGIKLISMGVSGPIAFLPFEEVECNVSDAAIKISQSTSIAKVAVLRLD